MLRWIVRISVVCVLLAGIGIALVYFVSEARMRSYQRPPAFTFAIPTDAASIARGDHLVRTRGCRGCHGDELQGSLMWGFALAPNLADYARHQSPAVFEAAFRHGIGADGRALYSMPAYNFIRLRDEDVAAIYSYLRTVPVVHKDLPRASLPWAIRWDIALDKDGPIPKFLHLVPPLRRASDPDARVARGEYLAMTACNECHGFGLRADSPFPDESAPDLIVVMGYDEVAFRHLMRTGKALGNRELEMMSPVARGRFAYWTDDEVTDLYTFLRDMGTRAISATHKN
jgi:mono/diheme cytochrome c family protein